MGLLDSLLVAGQELLKSTSGSATNAMGVPKQGEPGRQEALSGLSKGALIGGALTMLLGTKAGRNVGGGALKIGSMAALASVAYKAYQNFGANKAAPATQNSLNFDDFNKSDKSDEIASTTENTKAILKAIIAGAKSNGHVDPDQKHIIQQSIEQANATPEIISYLQSEIAKPLDINEFAKYAKDSALASQIYIASVMVTNSNNDIDSDEQQFLDSLASTLKLDPLFVEQLHQQIVQS